MPKCHECDLLLEEDKGLCWTYNDVDYYLCSKRCFKVFMKGDGWEGTGL